MLTMPEDSQNCLNTAKICLIEKFESISKALYLTGPIPRISGENCGGDFYHEAQCINRDNIPEEQALLSKDGILITGCCHAGIINTVLFCRKQHPEIQIRKIVGGLHLRHADQVRLKMTADFLRENGIRELYLFHCTGENAVEYMRNALSDVKVCVPELGTEFEI